MMRLRRASVIATLSLLAWAATASAECAWMLWDGQFSSVLGQAVLWSINGTYPTAKDCNDELVRYVAVKKERGDEVSGPRAGIALYKGRDARGYLECLPDTLDARGPKVN